MARFDEIEEKSRIIFEEILEFYNGNDPKAGETAELHKTENAYRAIDAFWRLFDLLGLWAQCHLAAHARAAYDAEFVETLKEQHPDIHLDSHRFEIIGAEFLNGVATSFKDEKFQVFLDDDEYLVDSGRINQILRHFAVDMLSSRSQDGNIWRYPLLRALRALNEGQYDPLLKPWTRRRVGQAFDLDQWRLEALAQVHFRIGIGWKKYRALEFVAEGIGQSVETLRSWEKDLKLDSDYATELKIAEIAGRHAEDFDANIEIGFPDYGSHRGVSLVERAKEYRDLTREIDLNLIANRIRELRIKDQSGG
ncbi:hypothetical protein ACLB6G_02285 [Zhengella sp. ZM62]|uniref:hypothetical protein n=1 Tax=Zhengella sedimenti TaxID=3390035 RepID=UPI003974A04B